MRVKHGFTHKCILRLCHGLETKGRYSHWGSSLHFPTTLNTWICNFPMAHKNKLTQGLDFERHSFLYCYTSFVFEKDQITHVCLESQSDNNYCQLIMYMWYYRVSRDQGQGWTFDLLYPYESVYAYELVKIETLNRTSNICLCTSTCDLNKSSKEVLLS